MFSPLMRSFRLRHSMCALRIQSRRIPYSDGRKSCDRSYVTRLDVFLARLCVCMRFAPTIAVSQYSDPGIDGGVW